MNIQNSQYKKVPRSAYKVFKNGLRNLICSTIKMYLDIFMHDLDYIPGVAKILNFSNYLPPLSY